jgi:signal transduction histidine kinase
MLVDELLHNHTTEQLQLQQTTVAINSLINNACSLLQHKAIEKQQKLSIHMPSKELMLQIDAAKIERVITNIIGNAIKFTPLNGSIWVEASMLNDCYIIAVKDNGLGIDEQNIHHIFSPFNTARKSGTAGEKSFGFGLSICKQIIEAHQGKIWVESTAGRGSTFYVQLPLNLL